MVDDKETTEKAALEPDEETPLSREEAQAEMDRFFATLEERMKDVPAEDMERAGQKIKDFFDGKIGWKELVDFSPEMLFQIAEYGFLQFKQGRYADAERVFKGLTILDWNNAYYHSVMGSILQRQKRYGEAIAEYSQALELDPKDVVSFTNRGEIFMRHGLTAEATADFQAAIALDPAGTDKFANRARMLLLQLVRLQKEKAGLKEQAGSKEKVGAKPKGKA
jgi:tetratricopeptide (TPR) repeat protein